MTDKSNDLDQSIQIALEAAAAANDSAEEVSRLSSETTKAADRLDRFAKTFKPVMYGVIGGALLAIALGGLTYMRTLSEMRLTNATQIEALGLFATTVRDLQASLAEIEVLVADVETLKNDQSTILQRLDGTPEQPSGDVLDGGITALITGQHEQTREAIKVATSDLHLALSRLLAEQVAAPAPPAAATPPAQRPVERPAPRPAPAAPVRPQARPAVENPFSYP